MNRYPIALRGAPEEGPAEARSRGRLLPEAVRNPPQRSRRRGRRLGWLLLFGHVALLTIWRIKTGEDLVPALVLASITGGAGLVIEISRAELSVRLRRRRREAGLIQRRRAIEEHEASFRRRFEDEEAAEAAVHRRREQIGRRFDDADASDERSRRAEASRYRRQLHHNRRHGLRVAAHLADRRILVGLASAARVHARSLLERAVAMTVWLAETFRRGLVVLRGCLLAIPALVLSALRAPFNVLATVAVAFGSLASLVAAGIRNALVSIAHGVGTAGHALVAYVLQPLVDLGVHLLFTHEGRQRLVSALVGLLVAGTLIASVVLGAGCAPSPPAAALLIDTSNSSFVCPGPTSCEPEAAAWALDAVTEEMGSLRGAHVEVGIVGQGLNTQFLEPLQIPREFRSGDIDGRIGALVARYRARLLEPLAPKDGGGSSVVQAIAAAAERLLRFEGEKWLVIVSDGRDIYSVDNGEARKTIWEWANPNSLKAPSEVLTQVRKDHLLPDLSGVHVVICGVFPVRSTRPNRPGAGVQRTTPGWSGSGRPSLLPPALARGWFFLPVQLNRSARGSLGRPTKGTDMAVPTRFVEAGSHRGARDIHREATRQKVIALLDEVTLVDPEREKVERLAQEYRSSGVSARAVVGRGESAVEREDEGVVALATVDDLDASSVLAAANPRRDTLVQIVGRGPGPAQRPCPTFGLNLPCLRDRDTERASATALLRDLADITGHTRTSSSVHREHGPSAMALARTRRQTSAETVRSFAQLERTRDRSALHGFTWNGSQLPLLIEQRADRQIARGASQAMDLVSGDRPTAVALLSKSDRVDFYVIERGRLSLWVPVAKSAPVPQLAPVQRSTPRVSGRTVAVGLAVGAVAALALAATAGTAAVAAPAAVPAAFTD